MNFAYIMAKFIVDNSPERAESMAFEASRQFALGVVIVNYRTAPLTEGCLKSLSPMLADADAGVVIVDNASGDGSFERLSGFCAAHEHSDRLLVLEAPRNGGFSAGNNIGVNAISAPLILFLNSDAVARPGALAHLIAAAARHPQAGVITPRIVSSSGADEVSRFRNHSPLSEFLGGAQTGPLTKLFAHAETPIFPDDLTSPPDWVSFAAVLIRRDALKSAGPMDEGFFLYYEDCDYCRRITAEGYAIIYEAAATFQHDQGGSTKLGEKNRQGTRLPEYYFRSRNRYFRKYYGPLGPALANMAWLFGRAIARLRGIFGRPAPTICEQQSRDMWIGWRSSVD